MFRSPTCGPSGVERRRIEPAGTVHEYPLRGGMVWEWVRVREGFEAMDS